MTKTLIMQRLTQIAIGAVALVLVFTGCKKEPPSALDYIPASSDMVLTMNMGQMSDKMNFNAIKNSTGLGFIGGLLQMQGIPNFIADRSVTGVDFEKNFYLFLDMDESNEPQGGVVFTIADRETFLTFIDKVGKNIAIQEGDGFSYLSAGDGVLGWKGNIGLLLMEEAIDESPSALLGQYFALPKDESIQTSEQADALVSGAHDISMVLRLADFQKAAAEEGVTFDIGEDAVFLSAMDFKEGEMVATGELMASKETMDQYRQLVGGSFQSDLLSSLPTDDFPAYFAMRMDGPGFDQFFETTGLYEVMARDADTEDLSNLKMMRDLSNALTGELFVGLNGMDVNQQGTDMEDAMALNKDLYLESEALGVEYEPRWVLAAGIADRDKLIGQLDNWVADTLLEKREGYYSGLQGPNPGIIVLRDNILYITTYDSYFEPLIHGTRTSDLAHVADKLADYPMYVMVNGPALYSSVADAMEEGGADSEVLRQVKTFMESVEKMEMISYEPTDTKWKSVMTLQMKNKDKNALEVMTANIVQSIMDMGMIGM